MGANAVGPRGLAEDGDVRKANVDVNVKVEGAATKEERRCRGLIVNTVAVHMKDTF